MGQIGEEEEKSDEKENKKHLISPASLRDQSTAEKLHQLARTLQSPRWMWEVWGCSKEHSRLFNTKLSNRQSHAASLGICQWTCGHTWLTQHTVMCESIGEHTWLRIELKYRQSRLISQPRINPNPVRNVFECRFLLKENFSLRAISTLDSILGLWNDYLMAVSFPTCPTCLMLLACNCQLDPI